MRQFLIPLAILATASALVAPYWALLPAYVEKGLGQPPSLTGALFAISMITSGIFFLFGGAVADSIGSRRTLLIGFGGLGLSGVFFLVSMPALLIALAVAMGIGHTFYITGSMSYLMRAVSTGRLGTGTGVFFVAGTFGMAIGSFICGPFADTWGYRPMGWIMIGGMALIVGAGAFTLPEVGSAHHERGSIAEAMRGYRALLSNRNIRWVLAIRFLPTCMWGAASVAFPYLLFMETGKNQTPAFYATTSLVGAAITQMTTGKLCDHFGIRKTVRMVSVIIPVTTLCTALLADRVLGLWICGILYTGAAWALSTTMPPLMNAVTEKNESGRIVGATHVAWAAGMAIGQLGAGWLVDLNPSACYYVGTLLCVLSALCAWRINPA